MTTSGLLLERNNRSDYRTGYHIKRSFISLIVGIVVGFCLAELFAYSATTQRGTTFPLYNAKDTYRHYLRLEQSSAEQSIVRQANSSIAEQLYKEVRVLCWVMTQPKNHQKKALHVKRTWGRRCNKLLFMSSAPDEELDTVALPVSEGRNKLWAKTKAAFKYVYENHINDADWFLKADDDTYVVVENLRYLLYPYATDTPIYFGCKFKSYVKQGYMSGGAGYVLSREAVRRLVLEGIPNANKCQADDVDGEDVQIGKCLENVNVIAGDSRDANGRGRFFISVPASHLLPPSKKIIWYWQYLYYKTDEGLNCCSEHAISFHYVQYFQMYELDYLIYNLRPFGHMYTMDVLPKKLQVGELMPPYKSEDSAS